MDGTHPATTAGQGFQARAHRAFQRADIEDQATRPQFRQAVQNGIGRT